MVVDEIVLGIVLGIVLLLLLIIIHYKVAKMFEKLAFDKGYGKDANAFIMCFWLGIVGYIYVAAMPKLTEKTQIK